jgi:hypothetical protein
VHNAAELIAPAVGDDLGDEQIAAVDGGEFCWRRNREPHNPTESRKPFPNFNATTTTPASRSAWASW